MFRKIRIATLVATLATAFSMSPARPAETYIPHNTAAFAGGMTVGGFGLFHAAAFPCNGGCPLVDHPYSFISAGGGAGFDVIVGNENHPLIGAGRVTMSGELSGFCEAAQSMDTTFSIVGHSLKSVFVMVGGTGVVAGAAAAVPGGAEGIAAVMLLRPLPTQVGQVPCLTEPATYWQVVGVGEQVR